MTVFILISTYAVIWLMSSYTFDNVIRYQFDKHYDAWVKDGKPRGMFYKPRGGSTLAFWKASFVLSKEMPEWVTNDSNALSEYKKYIFWSKIAKWYFILFFPLLILGKCAKI